MGIARPVQLALCSAAVAALVATGGSAAASSPEPEPERGEYGHGRHHQVDVRLSPLSPRPGDDVEVRVKGCEKHREATAHSEAFVAEVPLGRSDAGLFGEGRVSSSIEPGVYAVDVSCDGRERAGSARLVVVAHGKHHTGPPARPTAPVPAGGGGTADDESLAGAGVPAAGSEVAAPFGVTLLAGGLLVGAVVVAARRRRGGADGH
ncbi:hypothetical protein [Streptomyces spiramenti]|uniref:LPXTG cell wall anchor domain-containing protein n=1 Tax=Streptomyces spiramenti TaxID=2720606 RepID=A0ABX1ATC5_9ACTN|nr:hypothetical protein [Streptomyces spiramenti]NJP68856.1 hypothetical protein [Streptomyces spiramenti]